MCGRAVQTSNAAFSATRSLGAASSEDHNEETSSSAGQDEEQSNQHQQDQNEEEQRPHQRDNYNMSPGMDAVVIYMDHPHHQNSKPRTIKAGRKVWGLVPRGGSKNHPLPTGMSQHFSNLMFNARSDTLYTKPTFSRLAHAGKTCLIAVDGFFEWKEELKGNKQPYFVYRTKKSDDNDNSWKPYLLLAGLWTSVPTGRDDDPTLDTFTILTTEVCKPLSWLHSRMPVCIWDENMAKQWLEKPTEALHRQMEQASHQTPDGVFGWHAVTKEMSSTKFRSKDSIKPLPKVKTVKSYFAKMEKGSKESSSSSPNKRPRAFAEPEPSSTSSKKPKASPAKSSAAQSPPKRGTIDYFFTKKEPQKK